MIKGLVIAMLMGLLLGCEHPHTAREPQFRVQTFRVAAGWGYSVFIDGKEYIRQRCIPAMEGNVAFSSSRSALLTGNYVVRKLKRNAHPSLSRAELVQLHLVGPAPVPIQKEHP